MQMIQTRIDHKLAPEKDARRQGWLMVALAFLMLGVGQGNQYITSVLIGPLRETLNASAGSVLFVTMGVFSLVAGISAPFCGWLAQRHSLRKFVAIAFGAVSCSYVALAYVTAIWQIAIIFAVGFGTGMVAATIAANTLVSNWFVTGRGLALGIASAGIHFAGCVIPPFATAAIEHLGLRTMCLAMAACIASLLCFVWCTINESPASSGQRPIGLGDPSAVEPGEKGGGRWTLAMLARSGQFWMAAVVATLASGVASVLIINLMEMGAHIGLRRASAALLVSSGAASAVVGAVIFGRIFDTVGQRLMILITLALTLIPCAVLLVAESFFAYIVASVMVGFSLGASMVLPNIQTAMNFSRQAFPLVIGAINGLMMLFLVIAMPLFGAAVDILGDYQFALWVFMIALIFAAMLAIWFPNHWHDNSNNISLPGLPSMRSLRS